MRRSKRAAFSQLMKANRRQSSSDGCRRFFCADVQAALRCSPRIARLTVRRWAFHSLRSGR